MGARLKVGLGDGKGVQRRGGGARRMEGIKGRPKAAGEEGSGPRGCRRVQTWYGAGPGQEGSSSPSWAVPTYLSQGPWQQAGPQGGACSRAGGC